jgi:molecular chaperone GrpE
MDGARSFAIQKFAVDLLESIDNFDRALSVVPADKLTPEQAEANKDLQDLHQGLKMTENILMATLKKHGLQRFDPTELVDGKPQKFDPNRHEATFMAKAADKEDGEILYVQSKGYSLNGRVLRVNYLPY